MLLAKFEVKKNKYVFEKPSGNGDIVQVDGDAQQATWNSTQPVEAIVLKGARDIDIIDANGTTSGSFNNDNLQTRSGRQAGISNVQFCADDNGSTPPPAPGCGDCEGKVSSLTLRYDGNVPGVIDADIVVPSSKSVDDVFVGLVNPGDTFTINGPANRGGGGFDGTLGNELALFVNGQFNTQIHTSCSQPIHPGLTFGDFTVVESFSKNGGRIGDPSDTVPPQVSYSFSNGPDGVERTADDEIVVTVSDNVALASFNLTLLDAVDPNATPNLFVIENTFDPGDQSAFVRLGFTNFTDNTIILADVSDGCLSCTDTQAPNVDGPFLINNLTVLRFVATDETGLVKVEPFRLSNLLTPISPPLMPGATLYNADFALTPPGGGIGLLAADACNAFVFDPTYDCDPATGQCLKVDAASKQGRPGVYLVESMVASVPDGFVLEGNYPNPFNPSTEIRFAVPEAAEVSLAVYDVAGRLVQTLASGRYEAGQHTVTFEASSLPSGVYFYRLQSGSTVQVRPMTLLK